MNWLKTLWCDEQGAVLSAELVTIGTVAVLGSVAGLSVAANAVDGEMKDFAYAIRSLDQSYAINGHRSCGAYTAGSCFTQRDVQESIQELCADPPTPVTATEPVPATPVITDDAPKPNELPEPAKKETKAKKKAKAEKKDDDDDDDRSPSKPPKSRDND